MLIVALKPLTVKLPAGDLQLKPGCPVNLAEGWALKLLSRAKGKVRLVESANPDWLAEWHTLARITDGITADDPRFKPVMAALAVCEEAFQRGNWEAFQRGSEQMRLAVCAQSSESS